MSNKRIFLSLAHLGGQEEKYVKEAFLENWVTSAGPNINGFEEDVKKYLNTDGYPVALNSGTSSLHLGLILLGVKKGDTVICQTLTFVASANPILYQGATPVFIDSEKETWNMCPIALEEAILDLIQKGKKPKAIITVHLYGMPCKIEEIHDVASKYEIPILEDSAEALGSTYKKQKCGTFGALSIISFNGNKIITTSGGGILITPTKELYEKAIFYATQARENEAFYHHKEVGYNYRMSNICAGIGRGQMQVLDSHVLLRRKMHEFYSSIFSTIKGVTLLTEPNENYYSNHWLSVIIVDPKLTRGITREDLRLAFEENNIETRPLWKPMHLQPLFQNNLYYGQNVAEKLFENGLCLPSGSNLSESEKNRILLVLKSVFEN